jgi:dihydroorotase
MPSLHRRSFLRAAAVGFPALILSRTALSAPEYDLLIHGGRVIDPANRVDRTTDVAIRNRKIAAVKPGIAISSATEAIDARGRLVVPGLVDVHLHARDAELPPSEILSLGVTTMVDAGSRGADNFYQLIDIAEKAPNRMRMMLNIGRLGNYPGGRAEFLDNIDQADVAKAAAAVKQHRKWIVGIKARLSRGVAVDRDKEILRRALLVSRPAGIPVMIHMGDTATPLPELLAMLQKGDIVTHLYAPTPNGILDAQGRVIPEVVAARRRGVRFDLGHGLNEHWAWEVAEKALKQGFAPDSITSDLTVAGRTEQVFDLPNVMSKFLLLGLPLNQVVDCVTRAAAQTFRELHPFGTLSKGAVADVTLLEDTTGDFAFVDNYKTQRRGTHRLLTRAVVYGGKRI